MVVVAHSSGLAETGQQVDFEKGEVEAMACFLNVQEGEVELLAGR